MMSKVRWIKAGIVSCSLLALSGCEQVSLVRAWWQAWRNPSAASSVPADGARDVSIDIAAIARRHPAWKMADALEQSASGNASLSVQRSWKEPISTTALTGTRQRAATPDTPELHSSDFNQTTQVIAADTSSAQRAMTERQLDAWREWEEDISAATAADRRNTERAMRVDLNDAIAATRQQIPATSDPLLLSEKLQTEMIHLRLKLLGNIALAPADKTATEQRLAELESQWTQLLRQQAQSEAEKQRYWRETVPRQLREAGETKIQQTLRILQQNDQQSIDRTVLRQTRFLEVGAMEAAPFIIQQPAVTQIGTANKSTFTAPVITATAHWQMQQPVQAPARPSSLSRQTTPAAPDVEIQQLRQVAVQAAQRAAAQSALRHGWNWIDGRANRDKSATLHPDMTSVVLREATFP